MKRTDISTALLERIADVRELCPELRFGQILATAGMLAEDETGHSLWDIEDSDFVAALDRFVADLARSRSPFTEHSDSSDGPISHDTGASD